MFTKIPSEIVSEQVVRCLKPYDPEQIILFGSYARGDVHQGSDVDLIIIKDTESKFLRRMDDILDLWDMDYPVEFFVYTPAEFEQMKREKRDFILTVIEEGLVIYEKQQSDRSRKVAQTSGQ